MKLNTGDLVEILPGRYTGVIDWHAGHLAIVKASYAEQFYGDDEHPRNTYSLCVLPEGHPVSWFDADRLKLIRPGYMEFAGFKPYQSCYFKVRQQP